MVKQSEEQFHGMVAVGLAMAGDGWTSVWLWWQVIKGMDPVRNGRASVPAHFSPNGNLLKMANGTVSLLAQELWHSLHSQGK